MDSYYEALGVSATATPTVIRIAYEGKLRALEASKLDEAAMRAERRALDQAYATLSKPDKRAEYDALLDRRAARAEKTTSPFVWIGAVAVVLVAGLGWYFVQRSALRERIRLEEQRIAIEQQKAEAERVARETQREAQQLRDEQEARNQEARDRTLAARERSYQGGDWRSGQQDSLVPAETRRDVQANDERQANFAEQRERYEAEQERRKAQAEVERQKRWVAEREREEQRILNERDMRARIEAEAAKRRDAQQQPQR